MIAGVDSYGSLDGAALVAAGRHFAGCYISGRNPLTYSRAVDLTRHGVGILSLFETSPAAALGGRSGGRIAGYEALAGAELGTRRRVMPRGSTVVFAADFDCRGPLSYDVRQWWEAAGEIVRPRGFLLGGYGPQEVVEEAVIARTIDVAMVAGAWRSPRPVVVAVAALVQVAEQVSIGGVTCDVLEATTDHFGAWNLAGLWPPAPRQEDVDVIDLARYIEPDGRPGGLYAVSGSRKMPIATPEHDAAFRAANPGAKVLPLTNAELDELAPVGWGAL